MAVPTVTIKELSTAIDSPTTEATVKKVLIGILNDFMDLQYAKTTDYTTGKRVIPIETTIEDVDTAAAEKTTEKKFIDIFKKISEVYKSGDLTPRSKNGDSGNRWDPKLTPVLVVVRPDD